MRRPKTGMVWLAPFRVSFLTDLHSSRRRLYAGGRVGQSVHAASSLRERRIVFDRALLKNPAELRRIVTHELFHFAWARLGNPARQEWESLLAAEVRARARGELGWSAEWRKRELTPGDRRTRNLRWREYVCESFCDTAAWLLTGARPHDEATLAARHAVRRAEWFVRLFRSRCVAI
jgi:hypothetical protein